MFKRFVQVHVHCSLRRKTRATLESYHGGGRPPKSLCRLTSASSFLVDFATRARGQLLAVILQAGKEEAARRNHTEQRDTQGDAKSLERRHRDSRGKKR